MKKIAIPFVIFLALIGLAVVAYSNGYANEQAKAPMVQALATAPRVVQTPDEVIHPMSATTVITEPLHIPQKAPTAAHPKAVVTPTAHSMAHMTSATMHQDDHTDGDHMAADHMTADHMAEDHGVPAQAAAVKNPLPANNESRSRGAAIFSQSCAVCHGNTGEGDGPGAVGLNPKPADLHADHVQGNSDGALFWIISHGREGTVMPAWDAVLSEKERWDLVNFLRTFHEKE